MNLYPTPEHQHAAEAIVEFFSKIPEIETVCLTCSCARGKASRDSCLDILVLGRPETMSTAQTDIQKAWDEFYTTVSVFQKLGVVGTYAHVDLEFSDGDFAPTSRGWTDGPDEFELIIGNYLAYSVPLHQKGNYFDELREKWLPYYNEDLRRERLLMVRKYCLNNLDHIPLYIERGLHFQCFNRFYDAFREFLQALFIARQTYPIAYDKWIQEQVVEILELPELYEQLLRLFEIRNFESREMLDKAGTLRDLLDQYASILSQRT